MSWRKMAMILVASLAGLGSLAGAVELPHWQPGDEPLVKQGAPLGGEALFERLLAEGESPDSPVGLDRLETKPVEEPTGTPVPLSEKFFDAYFAQRPQRFLVDPQHLLGSKQFDEQLGFLNYHAADSAIDLVVYLFDRDQEIPGEVRAEELAERLFTEGRPAAVVLYFLGAPERTRLLLSPRLVGAVAAGDPRVALEQCIQHSREKSHPVDQLAAFAVQMSIRLYWMEKALSPGGDADEPLVAMARRRAANQPAPATHGMLARVAEIASHIWLPAICVVGGGLGLWLAGRWRSARRAYRFPEFEHPVRLGGPHAAGVGAVITFASAAVPPTHQREQLPEYLRRN